MNGLLEALGIDQVKGAATFRPTARYFAALDCLVYLQADCSYRALRLSEYVTILLHPQSEEAVGVKIKGTRHVIERYLAILRGAGVKVNESAALHMLGIAETALTLDGDEAIANATGLREKYVPEVKRLAALAKKVARLELPLAA